MRQCFQKYTGADFFSLRSTPPKKRHISVPHPRKDLGAGLKSKLLKQADLIRVIPRYVLLNR